MAILSKEQVAAKIKAPVNAHEIQKAKQKKIRHSLHTEADTDTPYLSGYEDISYEAVYTKPAHVRFLWWVKALLRSEENFERFCQLYRPPVPSNELTESIFSVFEKVFESQNAFSKFNFSNPDLESDFAEYRKKIGDFSFWQTQGFETFKNSIDSIIVVDLPKLNKDVNGNLVPTSTRPEPYYYIVDISNVIDIGNTKVKAVDNIEGKTFYYFKTEYVIFNAKDTGTGIEYIYCFDDQSYYTFSKDEAGNIIFVDQSIHGLGYCPARSFWTTPLNSGTDIMKRGPITNSLSELDWFLFFSIAEKYLQLYAPFPIYAIYRGKCDYKEQEGLRRSCIGGYLQVSGQAKSDFRNRTRCPACKNRIRVGPGNILELEVPRESGDPDLMANPMKVIPAERESLDYMKEALADKKQDIYINCVGKSQDMADSQAKNEDQVASNFESSESVLLKAKRNFEICHEFALDTVARLRYDQEYINGTVNYGDKFFALDEDEAEECYNDAVKNGLPEFELSLRRDDLNMAKYGNNPPLMERIKILNNLLPFPDLTIDKATLTFKSSSQIISLNDLVIKINFNSFINRFEREQTNILLFANALEFSKKIDLINEELIKYAQEKIAGNASGGAAPGVTDPNNPTGANIDTPTDIEAEAKAKLKGSVGGVQGILQIQASVASGVTDYNAAVALLFEIFGFDTATAKRILGDKTELEKTRPPKPAFA